MTMGIEECALTNINDGRTTVSIEEGFVIAITHPKPNIVVKDTTMSKGLEIVNISSKK